MKKPHQENSEVGEMVTKTDMAPVPGAIIDTSLARPVGPTDYVTSGLLIAVIPEHTVGVPAVFLLRGLGMYKVQRYWVSAHYLCLPFTSVFYRKIPQHVLSSLRAMSSVVLNFRRLCHRTRSQRDTKKVCNCNKTCKHKLRRSDTRAH